MQLLYFLIYTVLWFAASSASWYLIRVLVGRATLPVTLKEMGLVFLGCFLTGLLPVFFVWNDPDTLFFWLFYFVSGGTFFGALCGEVSWLLLGE